MKDILNKFNIFKNTIKLSQALSDFQKDTETITLTDADFLYIGYTSRFSAFYFYADALNSNDVTLKIEFFNGSSWVDVSFFDDTLNFSRNGFVFWDFLLNWQTYVHEDVENYFIRISTSSSTSEMIVKAINILFSTDQELYKVYYPLATDTSFLLGADDFTLIHEDVRNSIVQKFRNKGLRKLNDDRDRWLRVTPLDILDIQEVRQAATYFALSRIFYNVSDSFEDIWYKKYLDTQKKAEVFLDLAFISFDVFGEGDARQQPIFNVGKMWQ